MKGKEASAGKKSGGLIIYVHKNASSRTVTIPRSVCDLLNIEPNDGLEVTTDGKSLILTKVAPGSETT